MICKLEHVADQNEVSEFIRTYESFPATADEVVDAVIKALPNNVMCRANDRKGISSKVTNLFRHRADIVLSNPGRNGGTYIVRPEPIPAPVVTAPSLSIVPSTLTTTNGSQFATKDDLKNFATKDDLSRLESKVHGLDAKLDSLIAASRK